MNLSLLLGVSSAAGAAAAPGSQASAKAADNGARGSAGLFADAAGADAAMLAGAFRSLVDELTGDERADDAPPAGGAAVPSEADDMAALFEAVSGDAAEAEQDDLPPGQRPNVWLVELEIINRAAAGARPEPFSPAAPPKRAGEPAADDSSDADIESDDTLSMLATAAVAAAPDTKPGFLDLKKPGFLSVTQPANETVEALAARPHVPAATNDAPSADPASSKSAAVTADATAGAPLADVSSQPATELSATTQPESSRRHTELRHLTRNATVTVERGAESPEQRTSNERPATPNGDRGAAPVERGTANVEPGTWPPERGTTGAERRAGNVEQATGNVERETPNVARDAVTPERGTTNGEHGTANGDRETANKARGTGMRNGEREAVNVEREPWNLQRGMGNGERGTVNLEPATWNVERGTGNGERVPNAAVHDVLAGRPAPVLQPAAVTLPPNALRSPLPDETTQQIVQAVRLQVTRGGGEAHIRLEPRHLGELTITVRVENGQVSARLQAESPVVREYLQTHQGLLRESLADQQLTLGKYEVAEPPAESRDGERRAFDERRFQGERQAPRKRQAPSSNTPFEPFDVVA